MTDIGSEITSYYTEGNQKEGYCIELLKYIIQY